MSLPPEVERAMWAAPERSYEILVEHLTVQAKEINNLKAYLNWRDGWDAYEEWLVGEANR